jgi:hypothetical protein
MTLNTKSNGNLSLKVGTGSVQTFNAGSGISINAITIRAAVQNSNMEMDWRNLQVSFYSGNSVVETDTVPDFNASTMTGGTVQEAISVVTPTATGITGVSVVGQVRLQAAAGTYPGPSDIFGQVLVT